MRYAALVLDMDGTLVDSERAYLEATLLAAGELGYAADEALCHTLIGLPGAESDQRLLAHFGCDFPVAAFRSTCSRHRARLLAGGITAKPGAAALLAHCALCGLRCAVATSARRATAENSLASAGLRAGLDEVVTRDDVARGKPHPDVFLLAAERLGVAPGRCLAVEDSHNGVLAAHAAGMEVAMVPDLVAPSEEIRLLCRFVLADLDAVRGLLQAPPS